jgi:hypothetical protein
MMVSVIGLCPHAGAGAGGVLPRPKEEAGNGEISGDAKILAGVGRSGAAEILGLGIGRDRDHDGTAKGVAMIGRRGRQQMVQADGVDELGALAFGRPDPEVPRIQCWGVTGNGMTRRAWRSTRGEPTDQVDGVTIEGGAQIRTMLTPTVEWAPLRERKGGAETGDIVMVEPGTAGEFAVAEIGVGGEKVEQLTRDAATGRGLQRSARCAI